MKKILFFLAAIISTFSLFAQTKKIAHRSHSGSSKTFTTKGDNNFGLGPSPEERKHYDSLQKAQLKKDSIDKIRKADSLRRATRKQKTTKPKKQ